MAKEKKSPGRLTIISNHTNMTLLYYNMTLTVHDTGVFFAGSFLKLLSDIRTWCQCVNLDNFLVVWFPAQKRTYTDTRGNSSLRWWCDQNYCSKFAILSLKWLHRRQRPDLRSLAVVGVFKETLMHQDSNYRWSWFVILQWLTVINWYKSNSFAT